MKEREGVQDGESVSEGEGECARRRGRVCKMERGRV